MTHPLGSARQLTWTAPRRRKPSGAQVMKQLAKEPAERKDDGEAQQKKVVILKFKFLYKYTCARVCLCFEMCISMPQSRRHSHLRLHFHRRRRRRRRH